MAGFVTAMTFLNFAYFFYTPALGGIAMAVSRAAEKEFAVRSGGPRGVSDGGQLRFRAGGGTKARAVS